MTAFGRGLAVLLLMLAMAACDGGTSQAIASASARAGATAIAAASAPAASTRPSASAGAAAATPSTKAPAAAASSAPSPTPSPKLQVGDGKWHTYEVAGHDLAIACSGRGTIPVILEHGIGFGVNSSSWPAVMTAAAKFGFVCRYDRAFTGRSAAATSGRSLANLASDLRSLLRAAKITGPYVLVGHSFGGITTRYYAAAYPAEVAGIVLVDGTHQQFLGEFTLSSERLSESKVIADAKKLASLGKRPLVVLTRGLGAGTRWQAAQKELAKLSTNAKQVIATRSGHFIQTAQPDLVVLWIRRVLDSVRTGAALP